MLPTIVVVIIVAAIVAALFATGVVRFGAANSSNPQYETFSQARSVAQTGSGSVSGGPWYAVFGAALTVPTAVLEPTTNVTSLTSSTNCTLSWPHGVPANIAIPATPSSAAVGTSAYWTIGFKNITNDLLIEVVSDGLASALLTIGGGSCAVIGSVLLTFPDGMIDSPAIIAAANQAGGAAFLAGHPGASEVWGAVGGESFFGLSVSPEWYVEYSSCSFPAASGTGEIFNATLGGTSGAVISTHTANVSCAISSLSGGTPLGSTFAAGTATPPLIVGTSGTNAEGCATGHFCYVVAIESAGSGLFAGDMNFVLETATGSTAVAGNGEGGAAAGQFTIYNSVTAAVVAQSASITPGTPMYVSSWPTGSSTSQLASTMNIMIDTGIPSTSQSPSGTGLVFSALGVGSYLGSVSIALP